MRRERTSERDKCECDIDKSETIFDLIRRVRGSDEDDAIDVRRSLTHT
jgi:hypothetical protein